MAEFRPAFEKMIRNEGGYVNHTVAGDSGGQTYAGISRKFHPEWKGWHIIDRNDMDNPELTTLVLSFYKFNFWDKLRAGEIKSQPIAESLFDFAVNAGVRTAVKLAQLVINATPDGILGPKTLETLNDVDEELFVAKYALAKVARYAEIVNRNSSQSKFLLGWLNRTLRGV